jgi:NNP family nitrate/nitrite transporter-like MFS transporter
MGYVYGRTASYSLGLALLAVTAALTLVLTLTVVRRTASRGTAAAPVRPTSPTPRPGAAT